MNDSLPAILTLEEAAQYLRVTSDELKVELNSRRIPGLKISGKWRIKRETLENLFSPNQQPKNNVNVRASLSDKLDLQPSPDNKTTSTHKKVTKDGYKNKGNPSRPLRLKNGTSEALEFYQQAAIAKTEKRFEDARHLFKKAIAAGAGTQIYEAYFNLEKENGSSKEAEKFVKQAIAKFPTHSPFYNIYGQMKRQAKDYQAAKDIFQQGLSKIPGDVNLRRGLGHTLFEMGTKESFEEAGKVFNELSKDGKLTKNDQFYQRFQLIQENPHVSNAYQFFQNLPEIIVGIAAQRPPLPPAITQQAVIITIQVDHFILKESFNLEGVFLVACYARAPTQTDIINLKEYLDSINPQSTLRLLNGQKIVINPSLAFIAVPKNDEVRDKVMSFNSEGSIAFVPLDDAVLKETENAFDTLQNLLYQYLGSRNLYNSNQPVSGRRFFGREKLLMQLSEEVRQGHFLGIYGLRKIGKTSLVYQLRNERLKEEAIAYIDLQGSAILSTKNCASLYWELERDLYKRLGQSQDNNQITHLLRLGKFDRFSDLPENGTKAELMFNEDIRALLDAMSAGNTAFHKLVIVLDELEHLLPVDGKENIRGYREFFALLRGLAQTERYRGLLSTIVIAANAAISERGYWERLENPVFSFFQPVFLPPLSKDDCHDMIVTLGKSMSVYWEEEAIETIFTETAGHPFITRVLCSHIVDQDHRRPLTVTVTMVKAEIPQFIRNESSKFQQITELLHTHFPEEEKLLKKIALEEETPASLTDTELSHLLGYHLIELKEGNYHITLNLLRRWLRRRAGINE